MRSRILDARSRSRAAAANLPRRTASTSAATVGRRRRTAPRSALASGPKLAPPVNVGRARGVTVLNRLGSLLPETAVTERSGPRRSSTPSAWQTNKHQRASQCVERREQEPCLERDGEAGHERRMRVAEVKRAEQQRGQHQGGPRAQPFLEDDGTTSARRTISSAMATNRKMTKPSATAPTGRRARGGRRGCGRSRRAPGTE